MATEGRVAKLVTEVDSTPAEAGFERVATAGEASFDRVAAAASKSGKTVAGLGDSATPAVDKLTRAERSMIQSIERTIAAQTAGAKSSSEYYRVLAEQRGINTDILKPYLDQLDAIPAKQKAAAQATQEAVAPATKATKELVEGTKAYNAALRQVPAQFTDIIVSLQGGQAPMTVLLQQGGQLKDVFGSAGAAARALGGYVAGLLSPTTAAAAAIAAVGYAAYKGGEDIKAFELALALSGNASGTTTDQLRTLAATTTASADALTQFARAGVTGTEGLQKFSEAAVRFEKYTGIAVKESVAAWKSLGDEPVKNALKLNETVNFLTVSIYKQIKALEEQGKTTEAAALAQEQYRKAQQRISDGAESRLNAVAYGWDQIGAAINKAWKALKDFTNGDTVDVRIAASQATIAAATKGLQAAQERGETSRVAQYQQILDIETKRLFMLQSGQSLEKGVSAEKAEQAKRLDAQAALDREHDKYLSKAVERERELAKVRETTANANKGLQAIIDYGGAGADEARKTLLENRRKLAEAEAGINKKYADPKGPAAKPDTWLADVAKAYTKALDDLDKEQIKASASADTLSKTQEILRGIQSSPEWAAMSFRKKEEIIMAASLSQAEEDRVAVMKAAKAENDNYVSGLAESANAVEKKLQAMGDETKAYGLSIEKNISLAEAIDLVAIARLEEQRLVEMSYGDKKAVAAIEREIKARKELAKELKTKADHTAEAEAGKAAAAATLAEWKRGWEETDRLARDVFTTWAADGSNAAQKIGDTLKKALLSAIYEATLKPLVFQLYTSIAGGAPGGALGAINGAGSLFGGGSSGLSSTFSALGGNLASGFRAGLGAVFGESGTLGGLSAGTTALGAGNILGGLGTLAGTVMPWLAGASLLQSLTGYSVKSDGSALLANLGGGTTQGVAIRSDFTQSSSGIFSGGTTHNSDWKDADAQVTQFIQQQVKLVTDSARAYGTALGLPVDNLDSFKKQIEVSLTGLDAAGVQKALQGAIDGFANDLVSSSFGDALKDVAREGETSAQTLTRLSTDLAGVNQVFDSVGHHLLDVSVSGAAAASGLVQAAGGLSNLQSQLQSMYAQLASAQQDLADANRNAYDLMVESQDQANKALGNDSGGGGGGSNALAEAIKYLADIKVNIGQWLDNLNATEASGLSAERQSMNAWAALQTQLVLAKGGDRNALSGITGYADSYINAINRSSVSAAEARLAVGRVRGQVAALPKQVSPEQFIVDAINSNGGSGGAVATAVKSLGNKLTAELTVSARSEIVKMIEFVTDTDKLPHDLKQLALASADTMTKTVSFITGSKLTEENKQLALGTSSQLTKTINYGLGLDIPDEYKRIALKASDSIEKTISYTARNVLDPKQAALALMADNTIVKTLELAAGRLDPEALKVAYAQSETIRKMIEASGGVLTEDQQMLLNNVAEYNKQVNLQVHLDEAALTAAEDFLQTRFNTLDIKTVLKANDPTTVLRDFINSQISGGINGIAVFNVYQAAKTYGFTQQDIANAMGRSLADVEDIFGQYGIPKFAAGGFHAGGLALVGERGPELVNFSQPAQIYPADQTANLLRGNQSQTALVEEIKALRSDNQAQARSLVQVQQRMNKLLERWDGNGIPETRVVA